MLSAPALEAAAPLQSFTGSYDVTLQLGGEVFTDEQLVSNNLPAWVSGVELGPLPAAAQLSAFHLEVNGDRLFVLDTTVVLPGTALVARPRDVIRLKGNTYDLVFQGQNQGVPPSAQIDALGRSPQGDLILSFDVSLELDGVVAHDEDLLRFDGASFSLLFDGSAAGIGPAFDLDAAAMLPNGNLLISLDSGGQLGAAVFADEDVLNWDGASSTWSLSIDGSLLDGQLLAADLESLAIELIEELIFKDGFETPAP
jgi:hypothetical protein